MIRILLVSTRPGIAGVETLIRRMIDELSTRKDIHFSLLFMTKGKDRVVRSSFEGKCNLYFGTDLFSTYSLLKKEDFDYIFAFSLFPLIYAIFLQRLILPNARLACGVYHPLEYCWKHGPKAYIQKIAHKILNCLPQNNIFFMSDLTKKRHSSYLKRDFINSPLFPIPIDVDRFKKVIRKPNPKKIIALGRIVDFRTYLFQMVDVCTELNKQKIECEFHIYGDGPLEKDLSDYIKVKKADTYIFIHGMISYDTLEEIFSDAFLFIGCGTAMLEASAAGVPSIMTICPFSKAQTHGFFHEVKNGYDLGGFIENAPIYSIYEKILELYNDTHQEYLSKSQQCQQRAEQFSTHKIMNDFLYNIRNTKPIDLKLSFYDYLRSVLSFLYWKVLGKLGINSVLTLRYCENDDSTCN